jgi:lipopolysaccharide transport system ATP-binding protein
MSNIVISIDNVSKLYRLGQIGTGTLSHDLNRWWHQLRGKEDPYLKLGEKNDRNKAGGDWAWAIKDVSFDVKQGEVLGIIGKNGAGKSTLLKLLSRVTSPTSGRIRAKGRIASLLEVGTGFHPELTGRENIYLNGAILGMTKAEIKRKFSEIVEFSGVERYIDTPVKRYSSGMYVRLAFAVAAYLEPEILIVDEVLAVGDAEFQKKCLGKMKDVSDREGRTVLFVSHNMAAIKTLCNNAVLMANGQVVLKDNVKLAIEEYLSIDERPSKISDIPEHLRSYSTGEIAVKSIELLNSNDVSSSLLLGAPLSVEFTLECFKPVADLIADIKIVSKDGIELSYSQSNFENLEIQQVSPGLYTFKVEIENNLQPGHYFLTIGLHHADGATIDYLENIVGFEVLRIGLDSYKDYSQFWIHGYFRPKSKWSIERQ